MAGGCCREKPHHKERAKPPNQGSVQGGALLLGDVVLFSALPRPRTSVASPRPPPRALSDIFFRGQLPGNPQATWPALSVQEAIALSRISGAAGCVGTARFSCPI